MSLLRVEVLTTFFSLPTRLHVDLSLQPWLKKICPTCPQVDFSESCSLDVKMRGGEPRILLIFHLDLSFLDFINHEYNKHITTLSFQALSLGYLFSSSKKVRCIWLLPLFSRSLTGRLLGSPSLSQTYCPPFTSPHFTVYI